ncbi:MAG: flagellar assembly protein T N-terminal domain-containing protein [Methylobacter sp.]|uniref:flagellar assembly protein T N-terminal domain-containing protein n=1 Tax=Methylobacter sp. TaxID=2051955 RepID=UPI00272F4687|nr:flagellar assembly protein T N-terminal domain-containing protein [Methylobacter sp.]MDP1663717.1 flagellar assembly protein T N-terminal domain-containing protein [Methylobacter sp.]MDP1970906.1 flagellar assembly protein T N-terminal domain-containing protein [Methylobacter sp.]
MAKILFKCVLVSLILLSQSCATVQPRANTVTAEGQAAINNGMPLLAKKQALQDAIRQASMQSSVNIHSQTLVNQNNVSLDTVSMRTAADVSNTKIIKEWTTDNIYHVVAMVELSADNSCTAHHRKRIIATAFPLVKQEQVSGYETQDLYSGIPRELNNLLIESGDFIGTNATNINLYPRPDLAPELQDHTAYRPSKVMQIAASNGVQLVLSGVIRDLEIESTEYISGAGPLAFARSLAREVVARRGIGIDVYVHDGFTGALLFQQRYVDTVIGDVWIPATYTVGSERFNSTSTGAKIAQIIDQASTDIRQTLSCHPFTSRIIEIKGDKVFIDAGAQEKLNIGDQLVVYSTSGNDLNLDGGLSFIGKDKQPAGVLTIHNITPRYSIGSLEVSARELGVKVGDWVKSW